MSLPGYGRLAVGSDGIVDDIGGRGGLAVSAICLAADLVGKGRDNFILLLKLAHHFFERDKLLIQRLSVGVHRVLHVADDVVACIVLRCD